MSDPRSARRRHTGTLRPGGRSLALRVAGTAGPRPGGGPWGAPPRRPPVPGSGSLLTCAGMETGAGRARGGSASGPGSCVAAASSKEWWDQPALQAVPFSVKLVGAVLVPE